MTDYESFLRTKALATESVGFDVDLDNIHPLLFDWQRLIVKWALKRGRVALFEECGMGKTLQQVEWAKHVARHTGKKVMIVAPLAVAHQTVNEGHKLDVSIKYVRSQIELDECHQQIVITNYDMLKEFDASKLGGVVLDESSILKSYTGATKRMLLKMFARTPYRLACTATPSPNDNLELGNHAEFLGVMDSTRMISRWFINDSMEAGKYRLKHHAESDYWRWVTSWAVCLSKPSDLDSQFSDDGYILPPVNFELSTVAVDHLRAQEYGQLFINETLSATAMWKEKRITALDRCKRVKELFDQKPNESWVIWCDTNDEADKLIELFEGQNFVEVRGSHSIKEKEEKLNSFSQDNAQVIITKADIAGFGLNWQHCHNTAYTGVTYSFEKLYQSMRRLWRFGQTQPVNIHLVYAETEDNIMTTLNRKQEAHHKMQDKMNQAMRENGLNGLLEHGAKDIKITENIATGEDWTLYLGDCVTRIKEIQDSSVDFSIYSPPFSTLYIYSDLPQDMGNSEDDEQFFEHYKHLLPELLRITKPGRLCAVHCKDLPLYKNRDGAAGLRDFPGQLIKAHEEAGWTFHSRVTIWKDPVIEMQRTKNHGLLWKNFSSRAEACRQGMADYLIVFRKWTEDQPDKQVQHDLIAPSNNGKGHKYIGTNPPTSFDSDRDYSIQVWQKYASPVWMDIDQTNVLNFKIARDNEDEKHICPLQLDVIARSVDIWSNKGDVVFSPFAGVGSEGYESLKMDRKFIGIELKQSYFNFAVKHLQIAERMKDQLSLFELPVEHELQLVEAEYDPDAEESEE